MRLSIIRNGSLTCASMAVLLTMASGVQANPKNKFGKNNDNYTNVEADARAWARNGNARSNSESFNEDMEVVSVVELRANVYGAPIRMHSGYAEGGDGAAGGEGYADVDAYGGDGGKGRGGDGGDGGDGGNARSKANAEPYNENGGGDGGDAYAENYADAGDSYTKSRGRANGGNANGGVADGGDASGGDAGGFGLGGGGSANGGNSDGGNSDGGDAMADNQSDATGGGGGGAGTGDADATGGDGGDGGDNHNRAVAHANGGDAGDGGNGAYGKGGKGGYAHVGHVDASGGDGGNGGNGRSGKVILYTGDVTVRAGGAGSFGGINNQQVSSGLYNATLGAVSVAANDSVTIGGN